MQKIAMIITEYLIKKECIDSEDREFYCFAWESVMIGLVNYITMLILAICFNRVIECIVFVGMLKLLRENMGGIHMRTWYECYIVSNILVFAVVLCSTNVSMGILTLLVCYSICLILVWKWAPCTHPNNPISEEVAKNSRRKALVFSVGIMVITFILKYLRYEKYVTLCFGAVMLSTLLMCIGCFRKSEGGEEGNEENG